MKPGSGHRGGTILTASGDLQKIYNRVIIKADNPNQGLPSLVVVDPPISQIPYASTFTDGVSEIRDFTEDMQGLGNGADMIVSGSTSTENQNAKTQELITRMRARAALILQQSSLAGVAEGPVRLFYPQEVYDTVLAAWIPLHRIRAGELISVEDFRPYDAFYTSSVPITMNEFYIIRTNCNRSGVTLQIGIRTGLTDSIGRAIKAQTVGISDFNKSSPTPEVGRVYNFTGWHCQLPQVGQTNKEAPYSSVLHGHGSPPGPISATANFDSHDGTDSAPVLPAGPVGLGPVNSIGLIRGTWEKYTISCDRGSVKFHVVIPPGTFVTAYGVPGILPGATFDVEGGDGTSLAQVVELTNRTVAKVYLTGNPGAPADNDIGARHAALNFFGTRNL